MKFFLVIIDNYMTDFVFYCLLKCFIESFSFILLSGMAVNYGLDLLRGIAGYGVAITHYLYFVQKSINFEYYSFLFVEIFFVLSGFVLSNQLIKIYI